MNHSFKAQLNWKLDTLQSSIENRKKVKNHVVSIEGKTSIEVSAAKAFKGDPSLWNPEDLLLSSLMSCHMMSYLYVCHINKIQVLEYSDQAEAILSISEDGSGKIIKVILKPKVVISDKNQIEKAIALHKEANRLCFIANSCNFNVEHQVSCVSIN